MNAIAQPAVVALYQALCPQQLAALEQANWHGIQPGRSGEKYCLLKLEQRYAEMIARQWLVPLYGAGYVVQLILRRSRVCQYQLETVAYEEHLEYRVPDAQLCSLGAALTTEARLVSAFRVQHGYSVAPGGRPLAGLMG
jgi:hypothetical protein